MTRNTTITSLLRRIIGSNSHDGEASAPPSGPAPATGAESPPRLGSTIDDTDTTTGSETDTWKLANTFVDFVQTGGREDYFAVLANEVVYLVPGRGPAAGLHLGLETVVRALIVQPRSGIHPATCTPTELLVEGTRAVVIIRLAGDDNGTPYQYEIVFHLQCHDGRITTITEYSGDQYTADQLT